MYKTVIYNFNFQSNDVTLCENYNNISFQLIEATVNALKNQGDSLEIINGLDHFLEALNEYLKIANLDEKDIDIEIARILLYESVCCHTWFLHDKTFHDIRYRLKECVY